MLILLAFLIAAIGLAGPFIVSVLYAIIILASLIFAIWLIGKCWWLGLILLILII